MKRPGSARGPAGGASQERQGQFGAEEDCAVVQVEASRAGGRPRSRPRRDRARVVPTEGPVSRARGTGSARTVCRFVSLL
jgi:hypothetical protein